MRATADPGERAREICLRLLAVRPRTRAELATALRQRGIADEVAAEVLERYGEVGIIDDRAFADAWVTSRHHGKGLARRALAVELRRKGVDDSVVGEALDDLDPTTEAATARALVDRKLRTDRGGTPDAVFRRLVGMLARKGYPPGLAVRVVKEALADVQRRCGRAEPGRARRRGSARGRRPTSRPTVRQPSRLDRRRPPDDLGMLRLEIFLRGGDR